MSLRVFKLISPLQPLSEARDAPARAIANPFPELATDIVAGDGFVVGDFVCGKAA